MPKNGGKITNQFGIDRRYSQGEKFTKRHKKWRVKKQEKNLQGYKTGRPKTPQGRSE